MFFSSRRSLVTLYPARLLHGCMVMVFLIALLSVSAPSLKAAQLGNKAKPVGPCCGITAINTQTGIVTASENATGRVFSFQVTNPALLHSLKVGQGVYANFSTRQVSVDGASPCCAITSLGAGGQRFGPIDSGKFGPIDSATSGATANPAAPCCSILSFGPIDSIVTAQVNSTGQTFQFQVTDRALANSLKVGQGIYANLSSHQVSVDGRTSCCSITSLGNTLASTAIATQSQQTVQKPSSSAVAGPNTAKPTADKAADLTKNAPGPERSVSTSAPQPKEESPSMSLKSGISVNIPDRTRAPIVQSFAVLPGPIPGGQNDVGTVSLAAPPSAPVTIQFSSDKPEVATVSSHTLTIRNSASAPVLVTTFGVANPVDVKIFARIEGSPDVFASNLTVRPAQLSVLGCSLDLVQSGSPISCKVWLDGKAAAPATQGAATSKAAQRSGQGAQIKISTNPAITRVPSIINIAPGADKAEFQIPTPANLPSEKLIVSASYGGITKTAPVSVMGESAYTGFDPAVQGFQFTNYFTGNILIDVPLIGTQDVGSTSYGLCGGMSYAALDNFTYGGTIPSDIIPPASGTQLRSYLYARQLDTFKADNAEVIRQFMEWVGYPDTTSLGVKGLDVRSFEEFTHHIRPQLAAGHPVTLGLVKARPEDLLNSQENALVKNHQVLAIGYDLHRDPTNGTHWDIRIYDPNFPDKIERMHTHSKVAGYQTDDTGTQQTDTFRGFFATPYVPKQPYWVVSTGKTEPGRGNQTLPAAQSATKGATGQFTAKPSIVPNLVFQTSQSAEARHVSASNPNQLPDLVPALGQSVHECTYSSAQSCQQQCPPFTMTVGLGVKNLTPYGVSGAIGVLLQDTSGHTIRSWTVNGLDGSAEAYPGSFSYQGEYYCPAPGTETLTISPTPPANYVLIVTAPSGVSELQRDNNSAQIYIRPDATISP